MTAIRSALLVLTLTACGDGYETIGAHAARLERAARDECAIRFRAAATVQDSVAVLDRQPFCNRYLTQAER